MSYDLTNDAEQPLRPPLPGLSERQSKHLSRWTTGLTLAVIAGLGIWWGVNFYTDWLWAQELGYERPWARARVMQGGMFSLSISMVASFISVSQLVTLRLSHGPGTRIILPDLMRLLFALLRAGTMLTMFVPGIILGFFAYGYWDESLMFFYREPFGVVDPLFGQDISFYAVTLAVMDFLQTWSLWAWVATVIATLLLYWTMFWMRGTSFIVTPKMMIHFGVMGVILMLLLAWGHLIEIFNLVLSERGAVFGAAYTDVNARLPALLFLTGIALLGAVVFGVSIRYGGFRLMAGAFSLWLLLFVLAGWVYPLLFQRFQVTPEEFSREEPYISRNIAATRAAYGLEGVAESVYPAAAALNPAAVREHRATIDNIRLWDLAPLRDAYNQLQFMELYYNFLNMDSDRYVVDGRLRQVLIGARELDPENLPADARNWVNQHLQYTHGYGVAMSPATGFTPGEGRPEFFIQDIPIQGKLAVSRPEVYYGEAPGEFAIVNGGLREVNPAADFDGYDGDGGVPLSSWWRRAAFVLRFRDINLLLSDQVTPDSRIQYRRQVQERVQTLAPFLKLDPDPYPVLDDAGKLWWIQDAYTVTDRYPYATPSGDGFNYIRNSVKVVVDAYNGDVDFYVIDPEDGMIKMYRELFSALFKDIEEMPPDLRRHLRYPPALFTTQAQIYLRYHITEPQVFFNQAEQWAIPLETRIGKTGVGVTPSYLVMRLPGEEKEEFVLLMPFSPAGEKKNLVGWLLARNDGENYGQLMSFQLPDDRQIDGPSQVEARIENDQQVSQQFTLWDGSGSQIIRGQLLVIPMADTIVYVEPLYLQSEVLAFPELKKVILADNTNLVMADTIEEGLARLVGAEPLAAVGDGSIGAPAAERVEEIEAAVSALESELADLEQSLDNLRQILRGDR